MFCCKIITFLGLILTSPRSVTAIKLVSTSLESWKQLTSFCIGQATESAAQNQIGLTKILGTESGNSKNLANYILNTLEKSSRPLLLPCSDIARDTLSKTLNDGGLKVQKVVVYKTKSNEHLKDLLSKCMLKKPDVIVFFSPSTVNYVLNVLENDKTMFGSFQIVAIGPVTEQALLDTGIKVTATLDKPDTKSLLDTVNNLKIK